MCKPCVLFNPGNRAITIFHILKCILTITIKNSWWNYRWAAFSLHRWIFTRKRKMTTWHTTVVSFRVRKVLQLFRENWRKVLPPPFRLLREMFESSPNLGGGNPLYFSPYNWQKSLLSCVNFIWNMADSNICFLPLPNNWAWPYNV